MKKSNLLSLLAVLALFCGLSLASCENASGPDSIASKDDIVIVKGSIKTVFENAGCQVGDDGIEISSTIATLMRHDHGTREMFNFLEDLKGVDWDNQMLVVDRKGNVLISFALKNEKSFCKSFEDLSNMEFSSEDGYSVAADDEWGLFVKDKCAYFLIENNGRDASTHRLALYLENAKENPLDGWQKSALEKGKTLAALVNLKEINTIVADETGVGFFENPMIAKMYDTEDLRSGWCSLVAGLDGLKLSVECSIYSKDGKTVKPIVKTKHVDTAMLKYAVNSANFIAMMQVPDDYDWNSYFRSIAETTGNRYDPDEMRPVVEILDCFKGTVMASASLNDQDRDLPLFFSVAAQMTKDDARKMLELVGQAAYNIVRESTRDYEFYETVDEYGDTKYDYKIVYADVDPASVYTINGDEMKITLNGHLIICEVVNDGICLHYGDMGDGKKFASEFSGKNLALLWNTPKDFSFMRISLPFGSRACFYSIDDKAVLEVEITETSGNLLDRILKYVAGQL